MRFTCSLFMLLSFTSFCQVDTLVIGLNKFPLTKVPVYYTHQNAVVDLPAEYKTPTNKFPLSFSHYHDSVYLTMQDTEFEGRFTVLSPDVSYKRSNGKAYLRGFIGFIACNDLIATVPYIKSRNTKTELCEALMIVSVNDTLTEYRYNCLDGRIFSEWGYAGDPKNKHQLQHGQFYVTDLYYRRGNATYFLPLSFAVQQK